MAIYLILIGTVGVMLDLPASEIVTMQAMGWVTYGLIAGICNYVALIRAAGG